MPIKKAWRTGFTLIEIMIVVAIIGLLAAIAIPSFVKSRHNSLKKNFINDLRIGRDAFQTYIMDHRGSYPSNRAAGVMPPEMAEYLSKFNWTNATPVGGKWDWDYNTAPLASISKSAAIGVSGSTWTDAGMLEIDEDIDDGDLTTGDFRKFVVKFMYILE